MQKDGHRSPRTTTRTTSTRREGETPISMAWSGDVFKVWAGLPELEFVVPEEGAMHWTDNMMIPMHASNPQSAIMWMDFYYQPEVAARVADWVNYITPVPDAKAIIAGPLDDPSVARSELVFPTAGINARDYRVFSGKDEFEAWNGDLRADRQQLTPVPMRPYATTPSDLRHFGRAGTPNRGWRQRRPDGRIVRVTTDRRSRGSPGRSRAARSRATRCASTARSSRRSSSTRSPMLRATCSTRRSRGCSTGPPRGARPRRPSAATHTTAYRHEGIAGRRRALAARRAKTATNAAGR